MSHCARASFPHQFSFYAFLLCKACSILAVAAMTAVITQLTRWTAVAVVTGARQNKPRVNLVMECGGDNIIS